MTFLKTLKTTAIGALTAGFVATGAANAGNIIITGHDTDDHNASTFMNWAITALLNSGTNVAANIPTTSQTGPKIGYIGNVSASLSSYLGNYDNFQFYDLDVTSGGSDWKNAFTDNNDVLVIGSGLDFVNSTGSARLNAEAAAFTTYFNNDGNLFVNTEQGLGATYYDFIPNFGTTNNASLPGCSSENGSGNCMNVTAEGTARDHTIGQIVNANITHNRFNNVDPVFEVLSIYVNSGGTGTGDAITIAAFDATINEGGGFETNVPEPGTLAVFGLGLLGLGAYRRRKA